MKSVILVMAAMSLLAANLIYAQSGPEVLKAKGCMGCHDTDKKKIGPSFKDISGKHKGDKGAEANLVAKLKDGKGHAKANASEAEIKAAVQQVLSTK